MRVARFFLHPVSIVFPFSRIGDNVTSVLFLPTPLWPRRFQRAPQGSHLPHQKPGICPKSVLFCEYSLGKPMNTGTAHFTGRSF